MDLTGKNVVYVGAYGGIGIETCKLLINKKLAALIMLDLTENENVMTELKALDPDCQVMFLKLDIANTENIKSAIHEIVGRVTYIDVLINGAGILSDQDIDLTINVNLTGLIHTTLTAMPYMNRRDKGRGGVILNIASVMGLEPAPSFAVYCASKFGVVGFTRSLANHYYYVLTEVKVMTICPGLTDTPLWKDNAEGRVTFRYSDQLAANLMKAERQSPKALAAHILEVIETKPNDSMWISDMGKLDLVHPKMYWKPTYKEQSQQEKTE